MSQFGQRGTVSSIDHEFQRLGNWLACNLRERSKHNKAYWSISFEKRKAKEKVGNQ